MLYFLNYAYTPNTAVANRMLGYYAAMDRMGIKADIVYLIPNLKRDTISAQYKNIQVKYMWGKNDNYTNKILRYINTSRNLKKFIKTLKAGDIVYTHGITIATTKLLKVKGIKVFAEKTEHFSITSGGRISSLSQDEIIDVAKRLDGLIVISEHLKQSFIEQGVNPSKIKVVNMTVDPSRFISLTKGTVPERYIAYCGTASNNKDGVDQLIEAFAIVAKHIEDVKLYIIGDTPSTEDLTRNLKLIDSYNLKERIVFTGIVPYTQMPQILKNAAILALDRPDSIQAQCGFPTKLGEYLLTKNPVVVTKVGDIPKFLEDGISALLSEERNPQEFAQKLEWVLTHKNEADKIGCMGAKVAMKNFNCDIETKKLLNFLNGIDYPSN